MGNPETHFTRIQPARNRLAVDLSELWRYRELFGFLVWRDIKVRYKQAALGFAWAVIAPLAQTIVFSVIFGRMANMKSDGLPSGIFFMAGLIVWRYFQTALTASSGSLVGNQALLTKIYLPRMVIPTAPVFAGLIDLICSFTALILIMVFIYHKTPAATVLFIPVFLLVAIMTGIGVGLGFAALNVKYRDVREMVPFITQLWMYATVIVPFSQVPEYLGAYRYIYYGANPMAGVVEGFRWCLAHPYMGPEVEPPWRLLAVGAPVALGLLLGGIYYFRKVERQFADVI